MRLRLFCIFYILPNGVMVKVPAVVEFDSTGNITVYDGGGVLGSDK